MKRFTETEKWKDPWFRRLDGRLKLLWFWLCDQCDNAGIIDPDMELAAFQIGITVSELDMEGFDGRVKRIPNGKWMLTKFIPFQYGELSEACPAHKPVFRSLESNRVLNGYSKGTSTLQDKDKDKDKDKDTEKDSAAKTEKPKRPTQSELVEYVKSLGLTQTDGEHLWHHWEENGWKRGKDQILNWKSSAQKWKTGGWYPSQKPSLNGHTQPAPTRRELS